MHPIMDCLIEFLGSQNVFQRLFTAKAPPHTLESRGFLGIMGLVDYFAKSPIIQLPETFHVGKLTPPYLLAHYGLMVFLLTLPPFPLRSWIGFLALTASTIQGARLGTDIEGIFFPIWLVVGWLIGMDVFLLHGVPEEHVGFREVEKKDQNPRNFGILAKFNWALQLVFQMRGVNWVKEVKNVRRWEVQPTKTKFILNRLKYILISFFMMDLANSLVTVFQFHPDLSRLGRSIVGAFFVLSGGFVVQLIYCLCGIIMVATGIGRVEDWPPLYHEWSECYSMRRFWGKTYHQLFRRSFAEPTYVFLEKIGIDRRSFTGRSLVRFFAFFMSGIGHGMNGAGTYNHDCGCFYVFMYFFAVMQIEDVLATVYDNAVGRNTAKRNIPRTGFEKKFGYVWTLGTMLYMCRMLVESMGPTESWMAAPTDNLLEPFWIWCLRDTHFLKPKYAVKIA